MTHKGQFPTHKKESGGTYIHGNLGYEWSMRACGFMRNVPHSLGHLNSGSPVDGAVWEGLGDTLKVKIHPPLPIVSLSFMHEAKSRSFHFPVPVAGLPTTMDS